MKPSLGKCLEQEAASWLMAGFDGEAARSFERAADAYRGEGNAPRAAMCVRMWAALREVVVRKEVYR